MVSVTVRAPSRTYEVVVGAGVVLSVRPAEAQLDKDYPVRPVPFTAVHLTDQFWAPKIETNRSVSIPFAFEQCELTGRVENFLRAAKAIQGTIADTDRKIPPYPFDDTDIYKVIEGASYAMSVRPDPKLDAYIDGLIEKIATGKLGKYFQENCLLEQSFVKDATKTITDLLKEIGPNVTVTGFVRMQLGEGIDKGGDDFAAEVAKMAGK